MSEQPDRLSLLEYDVSDLLSIVDGLYETLRDYGAWLEGSEAEGYAKCIFCEHEWWPGEHRSLEAAYWRAFWRGDHEFPHDEDCAYFRAEKWLSNKQPQESVNE